MSEVPEAVHFDLVLEIGTDPIRGRVGREPQPLREFSGWIELAAALEAARTEHAADEGLRLGQWPASS